MSLREPATQVSGMLKSVGNRRLWIVLSACWIFVFGLLLWPILPQYQAVDVSQEASDECAAERNAETDKIGEKAFNDCIAKRGRNTTADIWTTLDNNKICDIARTAATVGALSKSDDRSDCLMSKETVLAQQFQPMANKAVDNVRRKRIFIWASEVFLPPFLLPVAAALLLFGIWLLRKTASWIFEGYER